jgi:hypothetical protein
VLEESNRGLRRGAEDRGGGGVDRTEPHGLSTANGSDNIDSRGFTVAQGLVEGPSVYTEFVERVGVDIASFQTRGACLLREPSEPIVSASSLSELSMPLKSFATPT